jgi:hypothetical protein
MTGTINRTHPLPRYESFNLLGVSGTQGEMLLKAKAIEMDFEALGPQMLERKKQLKRGGIPSDAEHAMVAGAKGSGDTPAAAARRRKSPRRAARSVQARPKSRPAKSSIASKSLRTESKIRRKAQK